MYAPVLKFFPYAITPLTLTTGVTDEATLLSPNNKIHPDYYMTQLSDLLTAKEALTTAKV